MFDHGLTDVNRILKLWQPNVPIKLTRREEEIKNLIRVRGLSNKQISNQLSIGESAVKTHVTSILKKYGLSSRTQLAAIDYEVRAS
jgi:DNA-binding NarL/FixJ family response regulator